MRPAGWLLAGVVLLGAAGAGHAQPAEIMGEWRIVRIGERATVANPSMTMSFGPTAVSGYDGCNSFGGGASFAGDTLSIGRLISTKRACEPEVMRQAGAFFDLLGQRLTWRVDAPSRLTLTAADGRRLTARRGP